MHSRLAAKRREYSRSRGARGAVTAELALTLPAIGLVLAIVLGGAGLTIDRGRLAQAAADGQRVHSFGGTAVEVTDYVHGVLRTTEARVTISDGEGDNLSCVTVVRPGFSWLLGFFAEPREATSCGLVVPR